MNNEGWRPEDKAPPTGEWLMIHTGGHDTPQWFPARLVEGDRWQDEEGRDVRGIRWWRYFSSSETPPAS
jgi:hypothetical protein